jgi:hypothetical protein
LPPALLLALHTIAITIISIFQTLKKVKSNHFCRYNPFLTVVLAAHKGRLGERLFFCRICSTYRSNGDSQEEDKLQLHSSAVQTAALSNRMRDIQYGRSNGRIHGMAALDAVFCNSREISR